MPSNRDYLTIGEVVEQLRERYPELSISKVRYYEDEKIINPERTPGGYRKFRKEDVGRLELALRLQKERYLPLNVIRQNLDMMDMGQLTPDIKQLAKNDEQNVIDGSDQPVPIDKAISSIGISPETAKMLESFGLVQQVKTSDGRCYTSTDIKLMVIAREMAKYGIEARHLRMYTSLAEKESTLFQQILLPMTRHKGEDKYDRIKEVLENLSDLSDQLKTLLLQKKVKEYLQIS
ncbi:MAG: MerR family transcriptional regulator [Rubrobacteridae bacterium]|nr:MerR family transcriptional regulator [Rubrobacteridae bacterium]